MASLVHLIDVELPYLGENIVATVYLSNRARRSRISISRSEGISIVIPARVKNREPIINELVNLRKDWVVRNWLRVHSRKHERMKLPEFIEVDNQIIEADELNKYAGTKITGRVNELAGKIRAQFNKIYIRNQKRCWGSCSRRQNLSFNWRLVLLPEELMDYVILHELTHLKHMNHSKAFWRELEYILPGAKQLNKQLKKYEY